MKKITLFIALFLAITGSAQQINDGYSPIINDFSGLLKAGAYGGINNLGGVPDLTYGGYQHLFVIRHANSVNNHQLQIASSFAENDRLFFRKIASSDLTLLNPTWIEIATRGTNTFIGDQVINGNLKVSNSSPKTAFEILEATDSKPQGQTASTKSVLKLSRIGTLNYSYNESAEFRIGHGGESVYGSKLDLYINGGSNTNSIPDQHVMTWNYNGNVGIGITNPNNKLDVNGTIHSKEVKVDMLGWSDFVFKKEYNLPTLAEVEKHINEKGYLENIPSEEEVLKNGISLGEMNAKLLQKIEELTLYTIQQSKEILDLKEENKSFKLLSVRLDKLEEKFK